MKNKRRQLPPPPKGMNPIVKALELAIKDNEGHTVRLFGEIKLSRELTAETMTGFNVTGISISLSLEEDIPF